RLEIFAVSASGVLYHAWQYNWVGFQGWTGWAAEPLPNIPLLDSPAVIFGDDSLQRVFATDRRGRIWWKQQTSLNGAWSDWRQVPPILVPTGAQSTPLVARAPAPSANTLVLVVRGGDSSFLTIIYNNTIGFTRHWELSGEMSPAGVRPALIHDGQGGCHFL